MDKHQLRTHFKQLRAGLDIPLANELVRNNFLQNVDVNPSNVIGTYSPVGNEIDVGKLNRALVYMNAKMCLPCVVDGHMVFRQSGVSTELIINKFGIKEPRADSPVLNPDIIIIPLLAFNGQRYRLGYGGGYYDRYLANSRAQKIGVAYDAQITREAFQESHDIVLDMVVTEKFVYK